MNITFLGSAREVTGSCTLVEVNDIKFLVDCGFFQGKDGDYYRNQKPLSVNVKDINFVLVTHSHIDHCGGLPKIVKAGFKNKIYCTPSTKDIMYYILLDATQIMKNNLKKYHTPLIYKDTDVLKTINLCETYDYHKSFEPVKGIKVNFKNSGHILGSAIIEVEITENNQTKKLVFSGDLGNINAPIVKDTEDISGCDALIVESTYGNRIHKDIDKKLEQLKTIIQTTIKDQGSVIIPAFSIERTEELIYDLNTLVENGFLPDVPVYLDSPLAKNVLTVYKEYQKDFDTEAISKLKKGKDIFNFKNFHIIEDSLESTKVINSKFPKIILAGSGMLSGGRIINYLPVYLKNPNHTILFVSYQAQNTLGYKLLNNQKNILIDNQKIKVKCHISQITAYSSHADQIKLKSFVSNIKNPAPKTVFINHGEISQSLGLKQVLAKTLKSKLIIPEENKTYTI